MSIAAMNGIKEYERKTGAHFVTVQDIDLAGDIYHIAIFDDGNLAFLD